MAVDKPVVQFSLAKIRKDTKKVEVLRVGISGSKTITFPDLMAIESAESDRKLAFIESCGIGKTWRGLKEWLSADDVAALRAEELSMAELDNLLKNASKYYEDQYGNSENDDASANS